jgi:hypothetical protein
LLDGKVYVTPKEDGQIDPAQLLKATYDSGVTAAEMDMTATGKIARDTLGSLALQVAPNRSFVLTPNELSKGLEALADTPTMVAVRGQLYKNRQGKRKQTLPLPYGQNSHRARCPTHEPHFKHRFMINQGR